MSSAWVYLHGARAGLTRRETENLPIGAVYDQVAAWLIEERGYRAITRSKSRDVFDF